MELSELTAYAEEKYRMQEQRKWAGFPGFSVLADPETEKWVALLMRQWDGETGTEIQRCDIKCGRRSLTEVQAPFLTLPFRMKGEKWVGVILDDRTDPEVVFRLFDRAMQNMRENFLPERKTMVLERSSGPGEKIYRETALPFARREAATPLPGREAAAPLPGQKAAAPLPGREASASLPGREAAAPLPGKDAWIRLPGGETQTPRSGGEVPLPFPGGVGTGLSAGIPPKIREMLQLYEFGDGTLAGKSRNFYRQGKFMEDYVDQEEWKGEFRQLFPTYHDLNIRQLRGYFTWRTSLREGKYRPAPAPMVFIYLYELLCGIGTSSPEESLRKMEEFETAYLGSGYGQEGMEEILRRWMREYAILHGLPAERIRAMADPEQLEKDRMLAVLREPQRHEDGELLEAVCYFAGKRLSRSPVLTKEPERGRHLFAEVWRQAAAGCRIDGKDIFTLCFGERLTREWRPLSNAIHREEPGMPDLELALDECRIYRCREGKWQEECYEELYFDRERFQALFREADRIFRKSLKTGHPLGEKKEEAWAAPFAEAALEEERRAREEAARPKITIDLGGLEKIRRDAMITRDSLLTEEEKEDFPENLTPRREGGREEAAGRPAGPAVEGPQRPAVPSEEDPQRLVVPSEEDPQRPVVPSEEDPQRPVVPSEEEPQRPAVPAVEDLQRFAAPAGEGPRRPGAFPGLDALHGRILEALLSGEEVGGLIRENRLMPSVVADTINEALFDEIGDIVVECENDTLLLAEDYAEDLRQLLKG